MQLILSIFPGIDLLGRAFEQQGYCVVRGPDVLWGGDIRRFHPPAGVFAGVIGGPPCPSHSSIGHLVRYNGHEPAPDLIPEYERCVAAALPDWFLMENTRYAPDPVVVGYAVHTFLIDNHWVGGEQGRLRKIAFGVRGSQAVDLRRHVAYAALVPMRRAYTVLAGHGSVAGQRDRGLAGYTIGEMCELQGLPREYLDQAPLTTHGKRYVIGNGVPLPLGRALAAAVSAATASELEHTP